jgi:hypothetical protein
MPSDEAKKKDWREWTKNTRRSDATRVLCPHMGCAAASAPQRCWANVRERATRGGRAARDCSGRVRPVLPARVRSAPHPRSPAWRLPSDQPIQTTLLGLGDKTGQRRLLGASGVTRRFRRVLPISPCGSARQKPPADRPVGRYEPIMAPRGQGTREDSARKPLRPGTPALDQDPLPVTGIECACPQDSPAAQTGAATSPAHGRTFFFANFRELCMA